MGIVDAQPVESLVAIREEFDLTIPDDRVAEMKGVRQAVEGIEALLDAKSKGIDVNAKAMDEFKKQQAGGGTETTHGQSEPESA